MKLLVFAHVPPPHHGQSFMVKLMLEAFGGDVRKSLSEGEREIECYHINCRVSHDVEDIGVVRVGKFLMLLRYCLEAIYCRLRYGVKVFYYIPSPGKWSALYRDWVVMLLCRPFFPSLILHWHASGLGEWLNQNGNWLERWITQALLGCPALSIALANATSNDARWVSSLKIAVVPNGILDPCPEFDECILQERKRRNRLWKQCLEHPECVEAPQVFHALYLAHCIREKGLFDSLEGVALFNGRHPLSPIHLTVAGLFVDAQEELEFRYRVAQPDLVGAVSYVGFVSGVEKKKLLDHSDCLCFPTYYSAEGLPLTIVEAMACGIPCITTRWRAIPEILPSNYPGYVDPKSPSQIAESLERLAFTDLAETLRALYLSSFSEQKHIAQFRAALATVVSTEGVPPYREKPARSDILQIDMDRQLSSPQFEETASHSLSILQIFSRYLQWGGEEGSVYRIGDALMEQHTVEYYTQSTAKLLSGGKCIYKIGALGTVLHNAHAVRDLRRMQDICQFDIWQIHNVLPALSPAVYKEAFRANIPVVHFLHNYRMGCINGFFLDHGTPCQLCQHGNFLHAVKAKCWQESRFICGWMGLVMKRIQTLDLFHKVSRWIAISEAQKAVHVEMGIPADRIDVIPHFYEARGPALPLAENGYALFLGRLSPEKGCMDLLKAWRAMPSQRKLVIAGDGPELPSLQKYAAAAGLTNVQFAGFVPKTQQEALWRGASFLVVPSIWMEPFGMVVLEAFSHGRPVVANAIGGLPELITHEKTGLLVPPFHPEALASEMERLFQNPDLLQSMSMQARNALDTRFSKEAWLRQINATYSKVLSSPLCITKS